MVFSEERNLSPIGDDVFRLGGLSRQGVWRPNTLANGSAVCLKPIGLFEWCDFAKDHPCFPVPDNN